MRKFARIGLPILLIVASCGNSTTGAPIELLADTDVDQLSDLEVRALSISPDDGICTFLDAMLDVAFDESVVGPSPADDLDPSFMSEFDDGPFGEAFSQLSTELAAYEAGTGPEPATDFDELNDLSNDQCGYPVMFALGQTARRCFGSVSGVTGEEEPEASSAPACRARDPRPQLEAGVPMEEIIATQFSHLQD